MDFWLIKQSKSVESDISIFGTIDLAVLHRWFSCRKEEV
jgi:hypothetical protein